MDLKIQDVLSSEYKGTLHSYFTYADAHTILTIVYVKGTKYDTQIPTVIAEAWVSFEGWIQIQTFYRAVAQHKYQSMKLEILAT